LLLYIGLVPEGEEASQAGDVSFQIQVPNELEPGTYANFLSVWHGPHDFTLDFGVTGQGQQVDPNEQKVIVPVRVVARVKIPLTLAEDVLRAMAENVGRFEEAAGRIRKPGDDRPSFPPEDLT
jgi:Protein of unknown function (DUF3467)